MKIKSHDAAILSFIAKLTSLSRTPEIQKMINVNVARLSENIRFIGEAIADPNSDTESNSHPTVIAYRKWATKVNSEPIFSRAVSD